MKAIQSVLMASSQKNSPYDFWNEALSEAVIYGHLTLFKDGVDGAVIPDPEESGLFRRSVGEYHGQLRDWRATIPGSEKGVHLREYSDRYELHIDRFDPYKHPLKHLVFDSPGTLFGLIGAFFMSAMFLGIIRRKR